MAQKRFSGSNFIAAFLAIFLITAANAFSKEDFDITSQGTFDLCQCASQSYKVSVSNTGDKASKYTIQPAAGFEDIIKASPSRFALNPRQKTSIDVVVTPPCAINPGSRFQSQIIISTEGGIGKALKQVYRINPCFSYAITKGNAVTDVTSAITPEQHEGAYNICENDRVFVPLLFSNKDNKANAYQLSKDGPSWAALNANSFSIPADKSAAVLLQLDPPAGSEGLHKVIVNSVASLGSVKGSAELDLEVEKCHGIALEAENAEESLCGGDTFTYKAAVSNKGKSAEDVSVIIEGAEWMVQDKQVNIGPNEKKDVAFSLKAPDSAEGKFKGSARAFLAKAPEVKSEEYGLVFSITPRSKCFAGEFILDDDFTNTYSEQFEGIRIRNSGEKVAAYRLSAEGPGWITVEPNEVSLDPGQAWNGNLHINPGSGINPGEYKAKLKLASGGIENSKEITITLKEKNKTWVRIVGFYRFYKYYAYLFIAFCIAVFLLRKRIYRRYKQSMAKRARLNALKVARLEREKAREAKTRHEAPKLLKPEKPRKETKAAKRPKLQYGGARKWLWIALAAALVLIILGVIGHRYVTPYGKFILDFIWKFKAYILMGLGVASVIIIILEFFRPSREKED